MKSKKKSVRRRIQAIKNFPDFFIDLGRRNQILRKLFFTNKNEYPLLKGVAGFIFGLFIGLLFYKIVISELEFSPLTTTILTIVIVSILATGCAVSYQMRCTCLLTFPAFCGRTGRGSLKALVIAYVITGPVHTLIVNTKEVIRTFACTTTLTYNLTKTKIVLIFKPFQEALMKLKVDLSDVKSTLKTVKQAVAPIASEFSKNDEISSSKEINDYMDEVLNDTKRSEKIEKKYSTKNLKDNDRILEQDYLKKLEYRCEGVMSAAGAKCRKIFSKAYEQCEDAVSVVVSWALCWPMKLTFVCNIITVLGGSDACDASKQIGPGFGKGYNYIVNARNMVASELKSPNVQYKLFVPKVPIDVRGAADTAQAIIRDFEEKRSFVDSVMVIVKRLLTLIIIRIILNAQTYQEQYISDIQFDNVYITKYFRKIDARRYVNGKHTLLPLKKVEKPNFIDPYSANLAAREKSHIFSHSFKIIIEVMTVSGLLVVERVYFEILDIVRRHGVIEFHQSGQHDLSIKVKGTGMVASIVRSLVKHFNFSKKIDQRYTNEFCLPRPKHLKLKDYRNIYGIFIIIFLMVILEGYVQRVRFLICAYFYPKREKKRILYSYNETLKQRISFYKYMKKKIRSKIRENKLQQDVNYLLLLKMRFPHIFGWLKHLEGSKRKCLVCGELESKKEVYQECPVCLYVYCSECWRDIRMVCLACNPLSSDEDSQEEPTLPADDDSD